MDPLASYFAHPRGLLGRLAGTIMAIENTKRNAWAVSMLEVRPGDRVLEIGFGPGTTIQRLASLVGDGSVAGADASREMVEQARRRNAEVVQNGRVDLRLASVASLPFDDGMFDRVLAVNSFHHWPDQVANLGEVRRVLKPGGTLVVAEQAVWAPKGADDCRIAGDLAALVEAAGFGRVEVATRRMGRVPTICMRGEKVDQAAEVETSS